MRTDDWRTPSPRLLSLRRLQVLLVAVIVVLIVGGVALLAGSVRFGLVGLGVALVVAGCSDFLLRRRVRAWGYCERDEDLFVRRGILVRRLSIVPYGRMQFVDVTAGPFERAFGLATVRMHTAAAASDARIPGLPAEEAARLRDRLSGAGRAQAAGL